MTGTPHRSDRADAAWTRPRRLGALFAVALGAVVAGCAAAPDDSGGSSGGVSVACSSDADCAPLDDGDACNGVVRCDDSGAAAVCRIDTSSIVVCDSKDDTACARSRCEPISGDCSLVAEPDGVPCEDGDVCTAGDRCKQGACTAGPGSLCACKVDSDCADDGDLCNGVPTCDTKTLPWTCRVKPESAVTCDTSADSACEQTACDPASGSCNKAAVADGGPCEDGDTCTSGDVCTAGTCVSGTDTCSCVKDSDCEDLDGDPCTGVPYCDKSGDKPTCKTNPATIISCSSAADTDCRKNSCDKALGACQLTPVADKTACDDGDACTNGEICAGGVCAGGTDICKCGADSDCAGTDDGNLCNGLPYCNLASGKCETNPATVVTCASVKDTACSKNVCQPATGTCAPLPRAAVKQVGCQSVDLGGGLLVQFCVYTPKQDGEAGDAGPFACDDGNPCTKDDACDGATCKSGTVVCACSSDADCAAKDDGDLCNGTMFCNNISGQCEINPSSVVTCPSVDDTACLKNQCAPKTGVCGPTPAKPNTSCDDGDACTQGDVCKLGSCVAGKFVCECQQDTDCAAKDDGDLCNGILYCDKTGAVPSCKPLPNSAVFCAKGDDTACLVNTCDAKTAKCSLQPVKAGASCDDGDACTTSTVCSGGSCGGGGTKSCDDGNPCTTDACDSALGCTHVVKLCDDGNSCTLAGCDVKTGQCKLGDQPAGTACNGDDDGCTVNDACDGKGSCVTGKPLQCTGSVAVCGELVCTSKGGVDFACVATTAADGKACDSEGSCVVGATCKAGVCGQATKPKLYLRNYGPTDGAMRFLGVAALSGDKLAVVGQARTKASAPATTNVGVLLKLTALGDVELQNNLYGTVADADTAMTAVVAVGDEEFVAGGQANYGKGGLDYIAARYDGKGKQVWVKTFDALEGLPDRLTAMVRAADGTIVLGGFAEKPGASPLRSINVIRISAAGDLVAPAKTFKTHNTSSTLTSLAFGAGGALYATIGCPGDSNGFKYSELLRLSATGDAVWTRGTYGGGVNLGAYTVVGLSNGELLNVRIGNSSEGLAKSVRYVHRTTATGVERWAQAGPQSLRTVTALPMSKEQVAIIDADFSQSGNQNIRLSMVDAFGNEQWSQVIDSGYQDEPAGAAALGDGGFAIVGSQVIGEGGQSLGQLIRTDRWGHRKCGDAGVCAAQTAASCDDGKVCTADQCDPKLGCTTTPALGLRCDPINGCSQEALCVDGACAQSANGRTYTKSWTVAGFVDQPHDLRHHDGKIEFIAAQTGVSSTVLGARFTESFSPIDLWGANACSGTFVTARYGATDKKLWGLWNVGAGATAGVQLCSTALGVNKKLPVCSGCTATAVDLVVTVDGGVWALSHLTKADAQRGAVDRVEQDGKSGVSVALPYCGDGVCQADESAQSCVADCGKPAANSCVQRCGSAYDSTKPCQCDAGCVGAKDCCADRAAACQAVPSRTPVAAAALPDAAVVVASVDSSGASKRGQVDKVDIDGKLAWSRALALGGDVSPLAIAADAKAEVVVAGRHHPNSVVHTPMHARLSAAGTIVWLKSWSPPDMGEADAVLSETDGGLVMSGWRLIDSVKQPALWRVDAAGDAMWSRVIKAGDEHPMYPRPGELARAPDGYLIGAGSKHIIWTGIGLIRTDLNGFASCVEAGKCAANAADACDDGKACTADACDPKAGCLHTPVATTACGAP